MPVLYDYQDRMSAWLQERESGLLAADMGTGKTPTAINAADRLGAFNVLVVCPAVAVTHWVREVERWSPLREPVPAVKGTDDAIVDADTVVISYDRLSRNMLVRNRLLKRRWDVLILDEAHMLRGFSKRTKVIYGNRYDRHPTKSIAGRADRVWLLTGTPLLNHPGELWTHLKALFPEAAGRGYWDYVERYCTLKSIPNVPRPQITGGKNLTALRDRLSSFMLRVRKSDVLGELPPLRVETYPLAPGKALKELRAFENSETGARLRQVLAGDVDDEECFATLRRLTGMAKADAVVNLLDEEIDGGLKKVVVFAHHRDVIARLRDGLAKWGVVGVDGGMSPGKRQAAIDAFQNSERAVVFVGQLQAASTAINLTAASDVVFAEADWTPAINAQAIARCYRHGQGGSVLARFVTLAGSIDEAVMRAVARKTATITDLGLD